MRIAIAQLNYKIGDFTGNFAKISAMMAQHQGKADLLVFSELCLSGYYPRDLLLDPQFMLAQETLLTQLKALTLQYGCGIIIGLVTRNLGPGALFHNSLALISSGKMDYVYHKQLLPNYNIFNETRHFAPGKEVGVYTFKNCKLGFLICEDGWAGLADTRYDHDPVDDLASLNCDAIICINGSPSNIGKQAERIQRFTHIAQRCQASVIFTNQIGGNDDIIYDGASFVSDRKGNLSGNLALFQEDSGIITLSNQKMSLSGFTHSIPISNTALCYQQILLGLKDYVAKCGFSKVMVGVSGGIDSALTLALAVQALGAAAVTGLAMPSRYSSTHSLSDSQTLCTTLGVKLFVASIEEEFTLCLTQFQNIFTEPASSLTAQNIQARLRGRLLMEYANQTGALVLSTGNKSELSVGYTTLYGDMTGGFNLIGDLYKTEVYQVAEFYNQIHANHPIPTAILNKAPSAELCFNQKDSDTLPEYDILDPILKLYLEGDLMTAAEFSECQSKIQSVDVLLIEKVKQWVNKAEFKRRQAAPIIRLQRRAFGYGRQFPIAASFPSI